MKTLLVFALILFNCLVGFTQTEFAPIGAEWYYTYNEGMNNSGAGYYLLRSIKDTTIDSKECKVLSHTLVNSKRISTHLGQSIVYQDTKENKVYRYLYGNFYLLYDFTKVVGDTIVIKEPYSASRYDSIVMVVDSVGIVTYPGNIQLKSLYVHSINTFLYIFSDKIIERMGNLHFLFPVNQLFCDSGCPDPLRCYNDDKINFSLYQLPCDAVYTNTNIVNTTDISVFPNPFINSFTIRNIHSNGQKFSIDIFNVYGQSIRHEVISDNMDHVVNLNGYPSGLYFLVVKTGNTNITYKLIKSGYLPG
jgi:hypothetical protein